MLDISALEPKIAEAAKLMGMLSQPVRLRLMCILLGGEQSVLSLAASANLSQPAMSHHLKKLRDANLVKTRRDGQTIYYSVKGTEVSQVVEVLHQLYCAPPQS
ncbi:MAG: metalloregulator ArsR/SmtB family transcription factor [Proteobacteria bacterium]|jgi:DNA-binding transcriptional ArsR family regulator|nr:metalloregulator ArsR/SmtB family transcription factor [Pseudomonadota bacterium]MDA1238803.1 metalloregulator ArsR/SmtB family transcription factor [Pseudomonadota bacterium]